MRFTITVTESDGFAAVWVADDGSVSGQRGGFRTADDAVGAAKAWVDNWNRSLTASGDAVQVEQLQWGGG